MGGGLVSRWPAGVRVVPAMLVGAALMGAALGLAGCGGPAEPMPLPDSPSAGSPADTPSTTSSTTTAGPSSLDAAAVRTICQDQTVIASATPVTAEKLEQWVGTRVWGCVLGTDGSVQEVSDEFWLADDLTADATPLLVPDAPLPSGCSEDDRRMFVVETPTAAWRVRVAGCTAPA